MNQYVLRQMVIAGGLLCAILGGAAIGAGFEKFVWTTPFPQGAEAGKPMEITHASPRDLTNYDLHLTCTPGAADLRGSVRTLRFGHYKPHDLRGQLAQAVFIVDGQRQAPIDVKLTAWDEGIEAVLEIRDAPAFLNVLEKGRNLRVEFPRLKSQPISLKAFGALSQAMRAHCNL